MLQLVLATLMAAETRAVTFDEAKADASKRMAYIGGLLDKHVFDKDKNPKGDLQAWYYVADKDQRAAAEAAIKARYDKDGRGFYFQKELAGIFAPLDFRRPAARRPGTATRSRPGRAATRASSWWATSSRWAARRRRRAWSRTTRSAWS
jgi:hypothetical protein